jgi:glycosyltransferase involved in cell wall biosynthesis
VVSVRRGARARRLNATAPHVLIIVQNLPVPLDRRVWLECQALVAAGYSVSVICPKDDGDPRRSELAGVRLYKYAPIASSNGTLGYLAEFVYCWLRTAALSLAAWRKAPFDVIQACNPPDTYWALARLWRLAGVKFIYDQHDLNPEVFRSRFGEPKSVLARVQLAALLWLERRTYRSADQVIVTNESYGQIARRRGGVDPADLTVVRSGPDTSRMRPVDGVPSLRHGRAHLLAYLGVMGPQDGVDIVIRVIDILVHKFGREDVHLAVMGFGDAYDETVDLARALEVSDYVTFTGKVGPPDITRYLSTADIGLSPDPLNPLNDVSTMNKTMEYMSFAVPVVAFDLTETRVSGGDAVVYVEPARSGDDAAKAAALLRFAEAVSELLDDPARRVAMALDGRQRAQRVLDWVPQRQAYVGAYDRVTGHHSPDLSAPAEPADLDAADQLDAWGNRLVPLDDDAIKAFARTRTLS